MDLKEWKKVERDKIIKSFNKEIECMLNK